MPTTKAKPKTETPPAPAQTQIAIRGPRLPYPAVFQDKFGIDSTAWRALVESIFPLAETIEAIYLALSYCHARRLDVFKRCVHIVPIYSPKTGRMIDTIWPGIAELRMTAFRTGEYCGKDEVKFGPDITAKVGEIELTFPAWAQVKVHRFQHGRIVDYAGDPVFWLETYANRKRGDDTPNEMWATRPRGQLAKCAEAAALRAAFPEDIGGDLIGDEISPRKAADPSIIDPADIETAAGSRIDALTERLEADEARTDETKDRTTGTAGAADATGGPAGLDDRDPATGELNPTQQLERLAIECGCPITTARDWVGHAESEADPAAFIRSKPWQLPSADQPKKSTGNQQRAF